MNPLLERRLARTVPTFVVGGVANPRLSDAGWHCPEPTCPVRDADPEALLAHAFTHPAADRRRGERRKAA